MGLGFRLGAVLDAAPQQEQEAISAASVEGAAGEAGARGRGRGRGGGASGGRGRDPPARGRGGRGRGASAKASAGEAEDDDKTKFCYECSQYLPLDRFNNGQGKCFECFNKRRQFTRFVGSQNCAEKVKDLEVARWESNAPS